MKYGHRRLQYHDRMVYCYAGWVFLELFGVENLDFLLGLGGGKLPKDLIIPIY